MSHVGSNDDTASQGADDEESTFSDDRAKGPDAEDDCPTVGAPNCVLRALDTFDDVDIPRVMRSRAVVMKNPPHFLRGAFRAPICIARGQCNHRGTERTAPAWKLFLMAPRMLLVRKARGGLIPKNGLSVAQTVGRHSRDCRAMFSGDWLPERSRNRSIELHHSNTR